MTGRTLLIIGFTVGALFSLTQACVIPFECIYIYNKQPKLCGELFDVPTIDGSGFIAEPNGAAPLGCACLTPEYSTLLEEDPASPQLDPLYADIEADARARCMELANDAGQDLTPCQTATLNKATANSTAETFDSCKVLVGTIDEDRDGVCPDPDEGDDSGSETDTGGDGDGDDGGIGLSDLPFEPPP